MVRRLADAAPRRRLQVTGTVVATGRAFLSGWPSFSCTVDDGTGRVEVVFVGRDSVGGIVEGRRVSVEGTAQSARNDCGILSVWNPLYRLEPPDERA